LPESTFKAGLDAPVLVDGQFKVAGLMRALVVNDGW
jgi:hypothetical protein